MPNTLTIVFTSAPSTEPVEFQTPNNPGVYVTGTQQANGTWQVVFTGVTKGTYSALTGRLKNYPAVTATIAANNPVLNIQQLAPAGTSASGSTSTSISVTANSSINATAYRFLTASAQAGPYAALITQASASYIHTVAAGATVWYEMQYVGGGFYDDSPVSIPFSGTANATRKILYLSIGDSVTQGDQQGGVAGGNTFPQRALARLNAAAPGVFTLQQQGYPGKSAKYVTDNNLSAILASITPGNWDLIIALVEFGLNDLTPQVQTAGELHTVAGVTGYIQAMADQLRAFSPKVKVIYYPITNRTDSYTTATFDADRRAVNFNNISAVTAHFDDVANITDEPLLYATGATTNTTYFVDLVHRTVAGADIDGRAAARAIARVAGITIAEGNLTTPLPADANNPVASAPPAVPANTGYTTYAQLVNAAIDSANPRRVYSTSTANPAAFDSTVFGNETILPATASSTIKFHLIVPIKPAGQSQVFSLSVNSAPVKYQDCDFSVFWNGSNYGFFEKGVAVYPTVALSQAALIHIVGSDLVRYYYNDTLVYTSTAAVPTATMCQFGAMYGTPVSGSPEIINVQIFAAALGTRTVAAPGTAVTWASLQNAVFTSASGVLSKTAGVADGWNAFATATQTPVVGSVWSATVAKPTSSLGSAIVSISSAKAATGQTSIGPDVLLYWDNALIRVFKNGSILLETAFTNASYVLSMTVTATGFQFKRDGVLLLAEVAATTTAPLYLNAELYSAGNSIIPASTLG